MPISLGIIGLGKMGLSLARGLGESSHKKDFQIFATVRGDAKAKKLSQEHRITCGTDNKALAGKSKILLLCVKPQQAKQVLEDLAPKLSRDHLLISICAAITLKQLESWTKGRCRVLRAMPNLPALVGAGMTAISTHPSVNEKDYELAEKIFSTVGRTAVLEENLFDGATALSACGPAFVFLMIEALSEAGVMVGISRDNSVLLAAQTLKGAAQMVLDQGRHPAALKDEVTTPAGCTIDGLMALEDGKLRATLIKAVLASTQKSAELRA